MPLRLGLGLGNDIRAWRATLEQVLVAERLGFELVAANERWGYSPIPLLTLLAANSSTIRIGSSPLNVWARTPGAIAQEIGTVCRSWRSWGWA